MSTAGRKRQQAYLCLKYIISTFSTIYFINSNEIKSKWTLYNGLGLPNN